MLKVSVCKFYEDGLRAYFLSQSYLVREIREQPLYCGVMMVTCWVIYCEI